MSEESIKNPRGSDNILTPSLIIVNCLLPDGKFGRNCLRMIRMSSISLHHTRYMVSRFKSRFLTR